MKIIKSLVDSFFYIFKNINIVLLDCINLWFLSVNETRTLCTYWNFEKNYSEKHIQVCYFKHTAKGSLSLQVLLGNLAPLAETRTHGP